jgi:hypothetical protein
MQPSAAPPAAREEPKPERPQLAHDHPAVSEPSARITRYDLKQAAGVRAELAKIADELEKLPNGADWRHGRARELVREVGRASTNVLRWAMKLELWDKPDHEGGLDALMSGLNSSSVLEGGPQATARRLRRIHRKLAASAKRGTEDVSHEERLETQQVGAVQLQVSRHEATPEMARSLAHDLREAQGRMKRAGFHEAYKGGRVTLKKHAREHEAGRSPFLAPRFEARYMRDGRSADTVEWNTNSLGTLGEHEETVASIVHEFGHRHYYRNLPSRAVEGWDAESARMVNVAREDVDKLADYTARFASDAQRDGATYSERLGTESAFSERVRAHITNDPDLDPETRALYTAMVGVVGEDLESRLTTTWAHPGDRQHGLDDVRKEMHRVLDGKPVPVHWTTQYGSTEPEEAYAEAFKLYVMRGPRALGPRTRKFFEHISSIRKAQGAFSALVEALR